jgi:hypothetical protein
MLKRRLALLTVLGAFLAAAPTASAAQRYASPVGGGADCNAVSPCGIKAAVNKAAPGDEVIVEAGDYYVDKTLQDSVKPGITIHGVAGQLPPRLHFSGPGQDGVRLEFGSTLRHMEIWQSADANALFAGHGTSVDGVIVRTWALGTPAATIVDSSIANSTLVSFATNGRALQAGLGVIAARNVTAITTGSGGLPIEATATAGASTTFHLVNVIAYAGAGKVGLKAWTDGSGAEATITASYSDYQGADASTPGAKILTGSGNRSEVPVFVDLINGDYHQAPGSPTIDAGIDYPGTDVDGDPRNLGVTTDIGADELVPAPAAATGPATAVTQHTAGVKGSVDAKGTLATYRFEYGRTTAYGSATPTAGAGSGAGPVPVGATIGALSPATTYHYRLVATGKGGVTKGADRTFKTASPLVSTPAPAPSPFAGVGLASTRLSFRGGTIALRLTCPAGTPGRCTGRARLRARHRRLGRAAFSIAAGSQARVKVRVSRAGRRLLGRVRRLRGRLTITAHDAAGRSSTTVTAVRIWRRR